MDEADVKLVPFTVSVIAALPAASLVGEIEVTGGATTVPPPLLLELLLPPPPEYAVRNQTKKDTERTTTARRKMEVCMEVSAYTETTIEETSI